MEQPSHQTHDRNEEDVAASPADPKARISRLGTLEYVLLFLLLCAIVVVILALLGPSVSNDSGDIIRSI